MLAKSLFFNYTPGKASRHVGIIITPEMKAVGDVLVKHRDVMGLTDNPYFFGIPRTKSSLRPWDILNRYSEQHNLKHLSTTNFRKYLATTAQVLDLPDQEISYLPGIWVTVKMSIVNTTESMTEQLSWGRLPSSS